MKKLLWGFLLLTLTVLAYDKEGVREVNRVRSAAGMITLNNNYELSRAAYHHAKYLGRLRRKGHGEKPGSSYYTGRTPSERMVRAGYPSRAGVENISYGDRNYAHSVRVLMSTLYHRLAFLDFRVDEMGSSEYGNRNGRIYVYDLASSAVAKLCRASGGGGGSRYIYRICADPRKKISQESFQRALAGVERRNPRLVLYPPSGARKVPLRFIRETPDPIPGVYGAGYPVTVQLNPAYYRQAKLKRFRLYDAQGKRVKAKVLTASSDPHHKLLPTDFALIPLAKLRPGSRYRVEFEAVADGKRIRREWSFTTGA
jgi:hypothetical protein